MSRRSSSRSAAWRKSGPAAAASSPAGHYNVEVGLEAAAVRGVEGTF
jgi:hypothetical protein